MGPSALGNKARPRRSKPMPTIARPQRPTRQVAALVFAAGMAVASIVSFFFDSKEGGARRHMIYDKLMAGGRDLGRWGGGKGRHLTNKAMGTVAEMKAKTVDRPSEEMTGTGT